MAEEGFFEMLQRLRRGGGGRPVAAPELGKPPLASFHEALRLLPDEALKALTEAGVNLERPSKDDRLIIDDMRKYNKLQPFPWPKPATQQGSPRDAGSSPK